VETESVIHATVAAGRREAVRHEEPAATISYIHPAPHRTAAHMSLFTGTTGYYRQFRPGIPEDVVAVIDQATPVVRVVRWVDRRPALFA
jgi:hypothetical protein